MKFFYCIQIFMIFVIATESAINYATNYEPVIGILSQQLSTSMQPKYPDYDSYIASSYVKYFESGGARVVPIWINQPKEYYEKLMTQLNGVVFPGGAAAFSKTVGYSKAGKIIYDIAVEMNRNGIYFPIWGTCLGFELLTFLSLNMVPHRVSCSSQNQALPLEFKKDFRTSKLFRNAPEEVIDILANENVTPNFHIYCLTDEVFAQKNLDREWRSISLNKDWNGFEFISSMEHKEFPFYGVQFHPEKNMFEWVRNKNISHTANAVLQAQYFTNFFVSEARRNQQQFEDRKEEQAHLIYNFPTTHTALKGSSFQECYLFKKDVSYNTNLQILDVNEFDNDAAISAFD